MDLQRWPQLSTGLLLSGSGHSGNGHSDVVIQGVVIQGVVCGYMCLCWCSGRGSKRKAGSDLNEETAPLDNKKEKTAVELKDEGQKVVIEHW